MYNKVWQANNVKMYKNIILYFTMLLIMFVLLFKAIFYS